MYHFWDSACQVRSLRQYEVETCQSSRFTSPLAEVDSFLAFSPVAYNIPATLSQLEAIWIVNIC